MSTTLHAFTSYHVKTEYGFSEIIYENDVDYDIAYGQWHYIYTILQYGAFLLGIETNIPVYDYLDDANKVKEEGMKLVEPKEFIRICAAVLENIEKLSDEDNLLIDDNDWYLFDTDKTWYGTFDKQKENIIYYAEKLLDWSKKGLYFVSERE